LEVPLRLVFVLSQTVGPVSGRAARRTGLAAVAGGPGL